MNALSILAWVVAVALCAPLVVFVAECLVGLARPRGAHVSENVGRVAVLVPAHDEEAGIAATVAALVAALPARSQVLVVADNCTDRTADAARAAGAHVVERHDPILRGKGYALAFGQASLAADPPDVVIVVDADCRLAPGSVAALCNTVRQTGRPAQAVNLLDPDRTAPPLVQISSFAFLVKNLIRARGLARMGGATLLTGTGMAFPWAIFASADLATGNIVEDLGLGIALTRQGRGPVLVSTARVGSAPAHAADTLGQRARWEGGFIATARQFALPTLAAGLGRMQRASIFLGLHLLVPPLALLIAAGGAGLALCGVLWWAGASAWPALTLAACLALAVLFTLIIWLREGRATLSPAALARAPLYIAWKLPVYLRVLTGNTLTWNRTRRR